MSKAMQVDNEKLGKSMLESEAKNRGYNFGDLLTPVSFERISQRLSFSTVEEMYAAVGCGAVTINQVLLKLIDFYRKEIPQAIPMQVKSTSGKQTGVCNGEKTPILIYVSNACTLLGLTITSVNGRLDPKTSQSIVDFTIKLNKKSDIDMLFAKVKQNAEIDDIYRIVT